MGQDDLGSRVYGLGFWGKVFSALFRRCNSLAARVLGVLRTNLQVRIDPRQKGRSLQIDNFSDMILACWGLPYSASVDLARSYKFQAA